MPIRAEVLKDRCISSGRCVGDEPSAFRFDADELVELLDGVTTMSDDNNEVIELH
jgi:ferredoxin